MKPASRIALKEWDVVVRALRDGRQSVLLRKGGVSDADGAFALRENEFFLFPTWEHQRPELLNDAARPELEASAREKRTDGKILIDTYAVVDAVRKVEDAAELADIPSRTVWNRAFVDQRLLYKPEKPLYLVSLTALPLSTPHLIADDPSYAGCVSWVPLKEELRTT